MFVNLFGRLDPLAAGKRSRKTSLNLKKTLNGTLSVFSSEMQSQDVESHVDCPDDFMITAWSQDIYSIFTNLIDNSLYWMNEKNSPEQEISVDVVTDGNSLLHIDLSRHGTRNRSWADCQRGHIRTSVFHKVLRNRSRSANSRRICSSKWS